MILEYICKAHNDLEAMPVGKKSASNETVPIFKLTHLWCKNH